MRYISRSFRNPLTLTGAQAAAHMGLPSPGTDKRDVLERRFSGDVLKIELSGPDQLHLSVVDVPGLFHSKVPSIQCYLVIVLTFSKIQQSFRQSRT